MSVVEIFRSCRRTSYLIDGEAAPPPLSHSSSNARFATFEDFTVMLSSLSSLLFSGGKWDDRFGSFPDKLRLLLFQLDRSPTL